MNFPTLYKLTSTGKIQEWSITTTDNLIVKRHGLTDGQKQTDTKTIKVGKNIGKSNETTPTQQAEKDAQGQWDKKRKAHYHLSQEAARSGELDTDVIVGGVKPMLAHVWEKQGHKIRFPAYVQPKLDGHRCIAVVEAGGTVLYSRTQKPILGVPHIAREIDALGLTEGTVLDGELYNHDYKDKFEELTSFIKRPVPKDGHEVVQYHVYDIASQGTFKERSKRLAELTSRCCSTGPIVIVGTFPVISEEAMMDEAREMMAQGYEGLMVRNADSDYKHGRSYDLQKVKSFQDEEFLIIGVDEGQGRMAGRGIFVCMAQGDTEEEFRCKMVGPLEGLEEIWENRADYIGRSVTVQFQDLTKNGIPRFPVALRLHNPLP